MIRGWGRREWRIGGVGRPGTRSLAKGNRIVGKTPRFRYGKSTEIIMGPLGRNRGGIGSI